MACACSRAALPMLCWASARSHGGQACRDRKGALARLEEGTCQGLSATDLSGFALLTDLSFGALAPAKSALRAKSAL